MGDYPFHYDMPKVRISDSEIVVQKQCRDMIAKLFPHTRVAAVPSGQKRTRWQQQQAKKEGLVRGFPDLILVSSGWAEGGDVIRPKAAFVEVKACASMTSEQLDWLTFMHECGHYCGVFRSDKTLEEKLREWNFR